MNFTPLDLRTWPRGQMFYYFSKMAPTGYSMTVELDVTRLLSAVKRTGVKFFPAYLWLVTRALNRQAEFKVAEQNGQLGYYDTLTPLYPTFHPDNGTVSLMWTEFDPDFRTFYESYLKNQRDFGDQRGVLSQPQTPPPANAYTVSCIPWISFSHFAVHSYGAENPYYFPSVEAGKYYERDGRVWLPLSLTCHHASTDGWHVHRFLTELQADMDVFSI